MRRLRRRIYMIARTVLRFVGRQRAELSDWAARDPPAGSAGWYCRRAKSTLGFFYSLVIRTRTLRRVWTGNE